ncbi:hypothetical protein CY652_11755 [Burkholderia sp. WAC0059]|nr:hypothetical protein CY652_11755 [Burkholderia sp. WAC0059]
MESTVRKLSRQLAELKVGPLLEIDPTRIANLQLQIRFLRGTCEMLEDEGLLELGRSLVENAPFIDGCTTLAQRCELLNASLDYHDNLTGKDGLVSILLTCELGDFVEAQNAKDCHLPLRRAVRRAFDQYQKTMAEKTREPQSQFVLPLWSSIETNDHVAG